VDPVGCCVGLRGIRIQNIVSELNGEKIDVVAWNADPAVFVANALSPAQILNVTVDKAGGVATVVVPDRQLSLAIGKEGQNVRLAAKLTGWRIDIKSASVAEAERVAAEAERAAIEAAAAPESEEPAEATAAEAEGEKVEGPIAVEEGAGEEKEPVGAAAEAGLPSVKPVVARREPGGVRFAEEILAPAKDETKKKKKKKGAAGRESDEDVAARRARRTGADYSLDEEEDA
jgi:N utilization substance protein A